MSAYAELEARSRELTQLREVQAIAHWDEACMMPTGGGSRRGAALAALTGVLHDKATDPAIGELLNRARADGQPLDDWQAANLAQMERGWVEATAVPGDLVRARALATSRCEQAWREARGANDWLAVMPLLDEVVSLTRQTADALADTMGLARYDALLETYEPDLRCADINPVFEDLKSFLPPLLDSVLETRQPARPLHGPFPVMRQRELCEQTMKLLGFDFNRGRFDVSHHPFCGGVPDDTRITTRYDAQSFIEAFMAICHETGHALYQQGLPAEWRDQPVGEALGAAVHESQSLLMELQVCRSREFISHMTPMIRAHFDAADSDPAWSADNLYQLATHVERGYIRVDADEVTYPLHVIMRFELEQDLLSGAVPVADLPEAWDAAMRDYLQLSTAGDDARGCMQDVHWYAGLFGYFPTYTLGALAAAQWFATARTEEPAIMNGISGGDLNPLLSWLRMNIHGRGRSTTMMPLLQEVTGSSLDASYYKRHVTERYLNAN